jgi:hypothetical protein
MIIGNQHAWLTGSRLYFERDPINNVKQPIIDFGKIEPVTPNLNVEKVKLVDSDGGVRRVIAEAIIGYDEQYEIRTTNLNQDNLALAFLAEPPQAFTQSATGVTNVAHYAVPGRLIKVKDANGNPVYGLSQIDAVTGVGGTTTYTAGTDYEVVSLERGLIRMITGGAFSVAGNIEIDYTPRAVTGQRLITPQTVSCAIQGTALLFWGRCGNKQQTVREVRVSLTPTSNTFQVQDYSEVSFALQVLTDPNKAVPAGRLLYWLGDLAAAS